MRRIAILLVGLSAPLGGAASASAADTLIGTTQRATPVDAYGARVVWSDYDRPAGVYRLTEHSGGRTRVVPVPPNRGEVFDVDLGPGPGGGPVAVYRRCRKPAPSPFDLDGRHGCDLHLYDFSTGKGRKLRGASSRRADEYSPAVWGNRLVFARMYRSRVPGQLRARLYWRRVTGDGRTKRLRQGPSNQGGIPTGLDLQERSAPFFQALSFGGYLRLATTTGSFRHLVTIPGSGAATLDFGVRGVSAAPGRVYWMLVGNAGEIWRHDILTGASFHATVRLNRYATGFAQDGDLAYYVRPRADEPCAAGLCDVDPHDIRRIDGLTFEPAPVLVLE